MIGSVSSGLRRRRPRNASRATVAATARPAGSRQPPPDRVDARNISACCESSARRPERPPGVTCRTRFTRPEARARLGSTLANGIAVTPLTADEPTRTACCSPSVTKSSEAASEAARDFPDRIVNPPRFVIDSWIGVTDSAVVTSGLCRACRAESLLASTVGTAGVASTWATGAAVAGAAPAPDAADPVAAARTGSAAAGGEGAGRGGSNVSGSTYPCGSLVTRVPKYT
jgi:hypothetical protein